MALGTPSLSFVAFNTVIWGVKRASHSKPADSNASLKMAFIAIRWSRPSPISEKTIFSPKELRPRTTNVKLGPGRLGMIDSARVLSINWFALATASHGTL